MGKKKERRKPKEKKLNQLSLRKVLHALKLEREIPETATKVCAAPKVLPKTTSLMANSRMTTKIEPSTSVSRATLKNGLMLMRTNSSPNALQKHMPPKLQPPLLPLLPPST